MKEIIDINLRYHIEFNGDKEDKWDSLSAEEQSVSIEEIENAVNCAICEIFEGEHGAFEHKIIDILIE